MNLFEFHEFYKHGLLCEIYLCTVVKAIVFESISRSGLPNNSKFSEGLESTHHYLFKCPKYTRQRNSLFRKLLQLLNIRPSENLLLFGSPDLDIDSNS
jgi:hypothetical protein